MRLQSTMIAVAAFALAATVGVAGQADVAKLRNPAALTEQAPADLQGELRHEQGHVRHRGAPRLGADRRRPLLQPGEERLLRRCAVLPRDQRLHGAVRDPRHARPCSRPGAAANLKDDPVKQSNKRGIVTFATAGPEHAHDAVLHQLRRQHGPRQAGLRALRRGRVGHGRRRQAQRRIRRRRAARQGAGPGPSSVGRERVSRPRNFPKLDYIKSATIAK